MWGLHSLDRKYIMEHDLEKMTACTHWVTWHELQIVQSEFILLFSFQWLLILSSVSIDYKLCHFQERFYINPEEQITHSQRSVLFQFESSQMSPFFDHHMKSCPWEKKNHWLNCVHILAQLCIYWPYPSMSNYIPLPLWSLGYPKSTVISFFWKLFKSGCLK